MTNNCRTECADCKHNETCLLEDYQCSMLEEIKTQMRTNSQSTLYLTPN